MYNSIQHFNEYGVKKLEAIVNEFIKNKKDISELILALRENLFELGRNIITEVLEDMDEYLRGSAMRKKEWEIVSLRKKGLITCFGKIEYKRTYFKPKDGGHREYLVDSLVGITPHAKVSADVEIAAIDEAIDSSYRKAGEKASHDEILSKQAVMNKVHQVELEEAPIEKTEKKKLKILYVEADEDHVALQKKGKKENNEKKRHIAMPKLVYVHEGIDGEKSSQKRKALKNVRYFGGEFETEELWLKVAQYINSAYDEETIETVYLSGDGASWIKQGLNWINKSKFVLDNHHLNKYITAATVHLNDETMYYAVKDAIEWPDKNMVKEVFKKILEKTESETKKEAVKDAQRYILNNWEGIEIKAEKGFEIVGCSAEGHISHVFSDRLSSRPKGWSKHGVDQMAQLRIYKKNGGKVYDLVMLQKYKMQKEEKIQAQDELIRSLRNQCSKYESINNKSIPVIDSGRKTGLYKDIKSKIGRCG